MPEVFFALDRQVQRRTVARVAGGYAETGISGDGSEEQRQATEALLRRIAIWFGCYLVWLGPYPSPAGTGGESRRGAVDGSGDAEAVDGEGGAASERVMVRHLRGRTQPKWSRDATLEMLPC